MSKPLTIVLELAGAAIVFYSITPPLSVLGIVIGVLVILAGAVGVRKRKPTT